MYVPDGDDTFLMPPPGAPKEIMHNNTRITAPTANMLPKKGVDDREAMWGMMATSDRQMLDLRKAEREGGKVDLVDLLGTPKGVMASPHVRGYGFVGTPSPAPGVDMSPMMTWGRLDGTPLLLDPTATPLDLTPGPSFRVPEPPPREQIAMRMADRAKAQKAQKAKAARSFATTPTSSSPYARPSPSLSPAGRSLFASKLSSQRKTGAAVGADAQLRASYNSPSVRKEGAGGKGGFLTPSPLPTPSPSLHAKPATPSHASSITDDLLHIPAASGKPKKGKSITDDLLI